MDEVAIIGGGPVGMGLAIDLAQRGHGVRVIEKYPTPQRVPKGQNLTQRTMEHLAAWGCEAPVRAARPVSQGIGGLTCYGTLLSDYSYDWLNRAQVRDYYYTANERLPQYLTEDALRARAAELAIPVDIATADAVADRGDHVTVTAGGVTRRARYAVGCDGARSVTRTAAGITETRQEHDRLMVLLVFRSPALSEALKRFPDKSFYCVLHPDYQGYWLFFGRVDDESFFFHAPVPTDIDRDSFDFTAFLHRAIGAKLALDITHTGFWDLRISHADAYRRGRIFLAGDAAHSHPPYGGYGINTGFEDARNLGWKLSADLQGWGGPGLLDSYHAERHPVFRTMADDFITRFIREDAAFLAAHRPADADFADLWARRTEGAAEVTQFAPNYQGSALCPGSRGKPSARGDHRFAARPGHHLAPAALSGGRRLETALGTGFTLLTTGPDPQPWMQAAGDVPLSVLRSDPTADTDRYQAGLVLIRPDAYVAWAGQENPADPAAILAAASGR